MSVWNWIRFSLLFLLLIAAQGSATEYQPWLGNIYEFEFRPSFTYQGYSHIVSNSTLKHYSSNDQFLHLSLCNALSNGFGGEIELIQANTLRQHDDIDQFKVTGRYNWQDDIAGDPLSLMTGLSYIQAFKNSVKDVSSFHHGEYEGEFFLSAGKEIFSDTQWKFRWWGVLGIGVAERGSPWMRLRLDYEKWLGDQQEMRLFVHALWGLGHQRLRLHPFHGYGPIQHQSVDIGFRYTHLLEYFGSASIEYSYRIHAQNFPAYTHRLLIQFLYTFGL